MVEHTTNGMTEAAVLERTARPLRGLANGVANVMRAIFGVLGGPGRYLQDFLNGVWLGHSLHAVLVDVVVGGSTVAVFLDLLRVVFGIDGLETATTWTLGLATLAGVGSILTGLTDYKDTSPDSSTRDVTILHGLINVVGNAGFGASTAQRVSGNHDVAFWILLVAYGFISVGSYIGGHVVYKFGYSVNTNAFSKGRRAKDFTPILPLAELPEATPTKATLGSTALLVVRRGDVVHALKDTCSHANGPLSEGTLRDDTIECPWHGSVFRLDDGRVVHGPATSRQVAYRARINAGQVEVQGPHG
jgi:nitrite reductase/ring-hydroxylating ferredoxin subunit/uncharacterized membrane protein